MRFPPASTTSSCIYSSLLPSMYHTNTTDAPAGFGQEAGEDWTDGGILGLLYALCNCVETGSWSSGCCVVWLCGKPRWILSQFLLPKVPTRKTADGEEEAGWFANGWMCFTVFVS